MALIAPNTTKATVIDGNDLAVAVRDPKVANLIAAALAYGAGLRAAGRDHSVNLGD